MSHYDQERSMGKRRLKAKPRRVLEKPFLKIKPKVDLTQTNPDTVYIGRFKDSLNDIHNNCVYLSTKIGYPGL